MTTEIRGETYYSVKEFADIMWTTPQDIQELIVEGKIDGQRIGKALLINGKETTKYLAEIVPIENLQSEKEIIRVCMQLDFQRIENYKETIADFTKAIELDPNDANAYYNRAVAKKAFFQDGSGAIADFTKVIELIPNDAEAYLRRGLVKNNGLHDYRGAIADYTKAIELAPKFLVAYYARSKARDKLQDQRGATADREKLAQIGDDAAPHFKKDWCAFR